MRGIDLLDLLPGKAHAVDGAPGAKFSTMTSQAAISLAKISLPASRTSVLSVTLRLFAVQHREVEAVGVGDVP